MAAIVHLDAKNRAAFLRSLVGTPYVSGGDGPASFDCYGVTRLLQRQFFGRIMPPFTMPRDGGRFAIASAIATHPERRKWVDGPKPVDGAIAIMSRQSCGFHMGIFLELDGGVIVHALEEPGVCIDRPFFLTSPAGGNWKIHWELPCDVSASSARAAA